MAQLVFIVAPKMAAGRGKDESDDVALTTEPCLFVGASLKAKRYAWLDASSDSQEHWK